MDGKRKPTASCRHLGNLCEQEEVELGSKISVG